MLYDLTLRQLSIAGTKVGVCLRLHGYPEVFFGLALKNSASFLGYMAQAKLVGYQMIAAGRVATINAVEPPDVKFTFADSDGSELRSDDPMYRVANEYVTHQEMRETIRETLLQEGPRLAGKTVRKGGKSNVELQQLLYQNICLLSLWLTMHDPEFANAMRQALLDSLTAFKQAVVTIACTETLAYVRHIAPTVTDLTEALAYADNSSRSAVFISNIRE